MEFDLYINMSDKLCSELLVRLKQASAALKSGQVLKVSAYGPGSGEDIKAWCELIGHQLVHQEGDDYFILINGGA